MNEDKLTRTQEEIVKRIKDVSEEDFLSFERSIYYPFLDYKHVLYFTKPGTTEEDWGTQMKPTREVILGEMVKYMSFAWEKANGCRGISAERSNYHFVAWLWLLNDGFLEKMEDVEYEHYGKERLIAICEEYDWGWQQWDDGVRTNIG